MNASFASRSRCYCCCCCVFPPLTSPTVNDEGVYCFAKQRRSNHDERRKHRLVGATSFSYHKNNSFLSLLKVSLVNGVDWTRTTTRPTSSQPSGIIRPPSEKFRIKYTVDELANDDGFNIHFPEMRSKAAKDGQEATGQRPSRGHKNDECNYIPPKYIGENPKELAESRCRGLLLVIDIVFITYHYTLIYSITTTSWNTSQPDDAPLYPGGLKHRNKQPPQKIQSTPKFTSSPIPIVSKIKTGLDLNVVNIR